MGKYGDTAVKAVDFINEGMEPEKAWIKACDIFFERGSASHSKGCPKSAFLGLYGGKGKNAEYAQSALQYLKDNSVQDISQVELWEIVMNGEKKSHNGQMDVILSLYKSGLV